MGKILIHPYILALNTQVSTNEDFFTIAKNVGRAKAYRSAGTAPREAFLGTGLISKYTSLHSLPGTVLKLLRDFDRHGPAGPTAFWKISNEIDDRELSIIGDEELEIIGIVNDDDEDEDDSVNESVSNGPMVFTIFHI